MTEKIRILFLSANPWTTSRILVDEEAREIFERIQEGPYRNRFELHKHTATRAIDLQRLLLLHKPHIVHFSGHASKKHKLILGGAPGRGKTIDQQGLVAVLALYNHHLRLVLLNACFTKTQARSIAEVIDYSVGTGRGIGDKGSVAFAGAFYRALGFGKSIREAFDSARAELVLTRLPRTQGIELFVREGISEKDSFPQQLHDPFNTSKLSPADLCRTTTEERFEITVFKTSVITRSSKRIRSEVTLYRCSRVAKQDNFPVRQ
jgi:CHAT domain-containing protein